MEKYRLQREKAQLQRQVSSYEEQLASTKSELQHMKKSQRPYMVNHGEREKHNKDEAVKLQMSLVDRDVIITTLRADIGVLECKLQEQAVNNEVLLKEKDANNRALVGQKEAAEHLLVSVRSNYESAVERTRYLEAEKQILVEQHQKSASLSTREQQLRKQVNELQDQMRASQTATQQQFENMRRHHETELRRKEEELDQYKGRVEELERELPPHSQRPPVSSTHVVLLCAPRDLYQHRSLEVQVSQWS